MSHPNFSRNIGAFIPPVLTSLLRRRSKYGWTGDYQNWETATRECTGYASNKILEKVRASTLKVKREEAIYERDGVLFDIIQYSWPLLSAMMWIAAIQKGSIKILDFGGALGSSYFQNKAFLNPLSEVQWNIVEQPAFSECGQREFSDKILQFFNTVQDCIRQRGKQDLLLLSCVIPYLEYPYEMLGELMRLRFPYIIIDNTYFNYAPTDRICIQKVPPEIYTASYPCWFLDVEKLKQFVQSDYTIISEHTNDSFIYLDGKKIQYKGMFLKIKK